VTAFLSRPVHTEQGNALIATVLILFGLTIVSATYILLATSDTQISGNDKRSTQALYVAEAGQQEALARLSLSAGANCIAETTTPTLGWGRYIVLVSGNSAQDPARSSQAADGLDNDADGMIDESGEQFPEVLSLQSSSPLVYPWVRVQYKKNGAGQILYYGDGDHNPTTPDTENTSIGSPEYLVTSAGMLGTSLRVIQAVAQHVPFPPMPATLYTETTNITFNGTQFEISGYDTDPATGDSIPGMPSIPGIATTGDSAAITSQLHAQQSNNIIGSGGTPSVVHTPYDLDMQAYFNTYAAFADIVYNGTQHNPNTSGWGGMNTYHVVEVLGDLHLSGNNTGGGVLLVQGSLDISGQFTWYGAIICLGNITFTGGGSGSHLFGGMMAGNGVSTSETYSGNAELFYSSSALNKLNFLGPFRIAAWREI
jgi:hypothetical protein